MDLKESEEFLDKDVEGKEEKKERITWNNSTEFVLNMVGYNVGLGNVWRFSYMCFKNGGGAFLIPYLLVAAFCGIPLLFQEIAMGQFTKKGCIEAWNAVPAMKGIGYAGLLVSTYTSAYFLVVMGWCLFYLVHSFTSGDLPWATCDNSWNTDDCRTVLSTYGTETSGGNLTFNSTEIVSNTNASSISSTKEFWNNYVLQKTDSIENMGSYTNWRMVLCYLTCWIACYLCILKGIRTTGKVVYVTVTVPYVMMTILLVRGVTLEGAGNGILFYITPDPSRLLDPRVWMDAGSQVLFSLGVCTSALYGLGSYNKFNNNCYKQAFISVSICCGSSIFVGFVVFSFLGHMAFKQNLNITDVAEGGPGLVFEVYPAAISLLPLPQLWSVIFFLMLVFIAIDCMFGLLEGCIAAFADRWPALFENEEKHKYRAGMCLALCLSGMLMFFDGGIYIFELLNNYGSAGFCLMWIAFFESVAIAWIYGVDRFFDDVKKMLGYYPNVYLKYCYKYFTPFLTTSIFIFFCVIYSPLKLGSYVYPWWADMIGWMLSLSVMLSIPVVAIKTFVQAEGSWEQRWQQITNGASVETSESEEKFKTEKV